MTEAGQHAGWTARALARIRTHWLLKMLGVTGSITAFMCVYFLLLRHPMFPVTVMPVTGLDRLIGFQPWSMVLYGSLWLYISWVPMLICTRRELVPYLSAVTLLSLVGFVIFFFWPTTVPRPDIDWARYPSVAFLKTVDASGNACPSLHVAFAVLSGLWLQRLLKQMGAPAILRLFNGCWCLGIIYSTMAIKQHVALDVAAGAALGLAVTVLHWQVLSRLAALRGALESR